MAQPPVATVVPAYNAAAFLPRTLPPTLAAARPDPVLVVDAGSTDRTAAVARRLGARVLRLPERTGPAAARNAGAAACTEEVILFLDADCLPHPDVVARVRRAFAADPELVSLTGSYDDRPAARNFASLYMNLRHHFVHQHGRREGAGFWAGCGAVRRRAFLAAGGFDAGRYPRPMIEDIELGLRLRRLGRTRLDPALQVTHLKRWRLSEVIRTDLHRRALPWAALIRATGRMPDDLNLRRRERLAAALAPLSLLALPGLPAALAAGLPGAAAAAALPPLGSFLLGRSLFACFARRGGAAFALGAALFHQVHLTYSAAALAWVFLRRPPRPAKSPGGESR